MSRLPAVVLLYFPQKHLNLGEWRNKLQKKKKKKRQQKSVISSERWSRWEIQDAKPVRTTGEERLFKARKARAVTSP